MTRATYVSYVLLVLGVRHIAGVAFQLQVVCNPWI